VKKGQQRADLRGEAAFLCGTAPQPCAQHVELVVPTSMFLKRLVGHIEMRTLSGTTGDPSGVGGETANSRDGPC